MNALSEAYLQRFGGIQRLYGSAALALLAKAHVTVVGIGGVGSWSAEALARSGVGEITLVDMDDICVTNTNRQIHALTETVGQLKTEIMAQRLRQINPEISINIVDDFIGPDNVAEIIQPSMDCVIDAIDHVRAKAEMIAHCKRNKITIVVTGGAGGQLDPTQITIADLGKTFNDPLIAKVRSLLRRDYGFSKNPKRHYSVPCVFSREQLRYPKPDGSVCQQKSAMEEGVKLDCAGGFGASTMVTASFGFIAAGKAIEKLLRKTNTALPKKGVN